MLDSDVLADLGEIEKELIEIYVRNRQCSALRYFQMRVSKAFNDLYLQLEKEAKSGEA